MSETQAGPTQEWQHESLACCMAQESSEEEGDKGKDEKIMAEEEVQVAAKEKLKEVNLGSGS